MQILWIKYCHYSPLLNLYAGMWVVLLFNYTEKSDFKSKQANI